MPGRLGDPADRYLRSMRAQGGADGANTTMTLACDPGARNPNGPVSALVPLCTHMGDVTPYKVFL